MRATAFAQDGFRLHGEMDEWRRCARRRKQMPPARHQSVRRDILAAMFHAALFQTERTSMPAATARHRIRRKAPAPCRRGNNANRCPSYATNAAAAASFAPCRSPARRCPVLSPARRQVVQVGSVWAGVVCASALLCSCNVDCRDALRLCRAAPAAYACALLRVRWNRLRLFVHVC